VIEPRLPEVVRAQWPSQPRFARVNGWRMHYVDEGGGDPVVLLHGNPTWAFLYRDFVGPLTQGGHRVITPDMIGFGLSEKPTREDAHSLDGHIANLTALLRGLDLTRITLVCHDWGGPTGLGFALSNLARFPGACCTRRWSGLICSAGTMCSSRAAFISRWSTARASATGRRPPTR